MRMVRRLVIFVVFAGVVGLVVREVAPDVNRYLELRRM